MRISDWSADVCSSDLRGAFGHARHTFARLGQRLAATRIMALEDRQRLRMIDDRHPQRGGDRIDGDVVVRRPDAAGGEAIIVACAQIVDRLKDRRRPIADDSHLRSEEHQSELQSLMRTSYNVFCLKKTNKTKI